jgi:chromosome segregation ATPase
MLGGVSTTTIMGILASKEIDEQGPSLPLATRRGWSPMFQHAPQEVRFAVVLGGYARHEVDSVVGQNEGRVREARTRLEQTELSLTEANSRVQALQARVSELEEDVAGPSRVSELANEVLDKTEQIGRELRSKVVSQAEAEREELRKMAATEAVESARAQASEIVAKAQRDRDELSRTVEQSRSQIDQFVHDSRMMAEQRARVVWEKAQARLRDPVLELERLNEQRRAMLKDIVELQELVDTSWRRIVSE